MSMYGKNHYNIKMKLKNNKLINAINIYKLQKK